jgi:hypothetical protein
MFPEIILAPCPANNKGGPGEKLKEEILVICLKQVYSFNL